MKAVALSHIVLRSIARLVIACALACAAGGVAAQGAYTGTLLTGLWSTPSEPGSGVTATHEEPVIFLTFFIYRGDRTPYWVSATVTRAPDAGGAFVYTGDLYETNGPPFGAPFDPAQVTYRKVGLVTFASNGVTATVTYTIDGVTVSKALTRFTLHNLDFSGTYAGAITYVTGNCTSPALNGRTFLEYGLTTITQPAGQLNILIHGANTTCAMSGNYLQLGSWGNASGAMSCTDGTSGSVLIAAMRLTVAGFTGAFRAQTAQCELSGTIGGIATP